MIYIYIYIKIKTTNFNLKILFHRYTVFHVQRTIIRRLMFNSSQFTSSKIPLLLLCESPLAWFPLCKKSFADEICQNPFVLYSLSKCFVQFVLNCEWSSRTDLFGWSHESKGNQAKFFNDEIFLCKWKSFHEKANIFQKNPEAFNCKFEVHRIIKLLGAVNYHRLLYSTNCYFTSWYNRGFDKQEH
jgi:hypothetical protein